MRSYAPVHTPLGPGFVIGWGQDNGEGDYVQFPSVAAGEVVVELCDDKQTITSFEPHEVSRRRIIDDPKNAL